MPKFKPSTDPVINPALFMLVIDDANYTYGLAQTLDIEDPAVDPDEIDEFLEMEEDVPGVLRNTLKVAEFYPGKATVDPRMRIVGQLDTKHTKALKKLLKDKNSRNLEYVKVEKASDLAVLLAGLAEASWIKLRMLRLGFSPTAAQLKAIGAHPRLQQLEAFGIAGNLEGRFEAVAEMKLLPQLRNLTLAYSTEDASSEEITTIAEVPFRRLEALVISGENTHTASGSAMPFLEAKWFAGLKHLGFDSMGEDEVRVLSKHAVIPKLETLDLRDSECTEDDLARLLGRLRAAYTLEELAFVGTGEREGKRIAKQSSRSAWRAPTR